MVVIAKEVAVTVDGDSDEIVGINVEFGGGNSLTLYRRHE